MCYRPHPEPSPLSFFLGSRERPKRPATTCSIASQVATRHVWHHAHQPTVTRKRAIQDTQLGPVKSISRTSDRFISVKAEQQVTWSAKPLGLPSLAFKG